MALLYQIHHFAPPFGLDTIDDEGNYRFAIRKLCGAVASGFSHAVMGEESYMDSALRGLHLTILSL